MQTAKRKRDSQRTKVYRAEREAFPSSHSAHNRPAPGLETPFDCELWVNRVLRNTKARDACKAVAYAFAMHDDDRDAHDLWRWPSRIRVGNSQGRGGAHAYGSDLISVSAYFRNPIVLLHEMAHLVAPDGERHGPIYAAMMLALIRSVVSVKAANDLKRAYTKHRVRFKPKRSLSPERKAALAARLAVMREERKAKVTRAVALDTALRQHHSTAVALANSDTSYR